MGKKLTAEQREQRDAERAEAEKKVGAKNRRMPNAGHQFRSETT